MVGSVYQSALDLIDIIDFDALMKNSAHGRVKAYLEYAKDQNNQLMELASPAAWRWKPEPPTAPRARVEVVEPRSVAPALAPERRVGPIGFRRHR
jgi:hypothetical protein